MKITKTKEWLYENIVDFDHLFIIGCITIVIIMGSILVNSIGNMLDEHDTTDYSRLELDGGNITFRLEIKEHGSNYGTWDLTYKLDNITTYEINITREYHYRGRLNQSAGYDLIDKIDDMGKLDLWIWVRNVETGIEDEGRLMHHNNKLKNQ